MAQFDSAAQESLAAAVHSAAVAVARLSARHWPAAQTAGRLAVQWAAAQWAAGRVSRLAVRAACPAEPDWVAPDLRAEVVRLGVWAQQAACCPAAD